MKRMLLLVVLGAMGGAGCSRLGYYRYERPERASPEEMERFSMPAKVEAGVELTGPMMAALKVAMDDYRPPWVKPEDQQYPDEKCLADWSYIDVKVVDGKDGFFYVYFLPDLNRCGPGFVVLHAGAVYVVDAKGRIVYVER